MIFSDQKYPVINVYWKVVGIDLRIHLKVDVEYHFYSLNTDIDLK